MVWWWGIKVDRIGIALKLHTIYTLADLFLRTCWRWEGWRKSWKKNGREKKRWRTKTNCEAMPIWSMSWGITLAWHHLILLFDRGTFAWAGYSGEIWRAKGTFIKGTEGNCQLTFPPSQLFNKNRLDDPGLGMTNCEVLGDGAALVCVASVLVTLPCKLPWDALNRRHHQLLWF